MVESQRRSFWAQRTAPVIFVLEREPYWTPELQRQFYASAVQVRGCRKWSELSGLMLSSPQTVAVIDFENYPAECLTGLAARQRLHQSSPLILISSPKYTDLEWVLREAGVVAYFADLPTGDDLARCCRRWLR